MRCFTFALMIFGLLIMNLNTSESKPARKRSMGKVTKSMSTKSSVSKSEQSSNGSKKNTIMKGKGKCTGDNECPEGFVCLVQRMEKAKKNSHITKCVYNEDNCENVTCLNNGSCIDGIDMYTCQCPDGFIGTHCEIDIDECENTTCMNDGTCIDGVNSYTCQCVSVYTGQNCEIDYDPCQDDPCPSDQDCLLLDDGYMCTCGQLLEIASKYVNIASATPGTICSPGHPALYSNNLKLRWDIMAAQGKTIEVTFTFFETEEVYDVLYVRDGPFNDNQTCLGVFHGKMYNSDGSKNAKFSQPINSISNKVSLLFVTDYIARRKGFCIDYVSKVP